MLFSSLEFLYFFLPLTVIGYFLMPRRAKNAFLLVASLAFYAIGEPIYLFLMVGTIIADYLFGIGIARCGKRKAKTLLIFAIVLNVSSLVFFKYYDLAVSSLSSLLPKLHPLRLALPIGISFYTFQALSYVIDVYKKTVEPQKNLVVFGTYVTLFPQLIAGPIVRYSDVEEELSQRRESLRKASDGVFRFCIGLSKKVLLANPSGEAFDSLREINAIAPSTLGAWLALIFFAFQIYFDFSGYSDMAIGLGKIFGFDFPENFNYPYTAQSITDFWRRWHITLSAWFREYVYIPLGGNRISPRRTYLNLLCVWTLTGLWHGASWNFPLWGAYFFVLLSLEKAFLLRFLKKAPTVFRHAYAIFFILIGWLIFAHDGSNGYALSDAITMLGQLFGIGVNGLTNGRATYELLRSLPLLSIMAVGSTSLLCRLACYVRGKANTAACILKPISALSMLILSTAYLVSSGYNPFLYFRF